ncbi:MAG: DNA-binding protein [Candidatus Omnitrophota bacterium]
MKKVFLIFNFIICACSLPCYADAVSSTELINNAKQYDGQTVVYSGEVIGDVMQRGEFVWINVNDGSSAIGIWVAKDLAKDIVYTGNYKFLGDTVEIEGVFHRSCPEHGGDLDIHADSLRKVKAGTAVEEKINPAKKKLAIVLSGVLCLLLILMRLKRR